MRWRVAHGPTTKILVALRFRRALTDLSADRRASNLRTKLADQVCILPSGWREWTEKTTDREDDRQDNGQRRRRRQMDGEDKRMALRSGGDTCSFFGQLFFLDLAAKSVKQSVVWGVS